MSSHIISRRRYPLEILERALNNTTLTVKRVEHGHIIDVGDGVLRRTHVDVDGEKKRAVKEALEAAERRHTRELRASMKRLHKEMDDDKTRALDRQQCFYEDLAIRVAAQRDRAEEERMKEMRKKFDKEKAEALREAWEEAERQKEMAIKDACDALRKQLRNEFAIERERAIAAALAHAREMFKIKEKEIIKQTTEECEKKAAEEAARVAKIHADEMNKLQDQYNTLMRKYRKELAHKQRVENDFRELQTDYQRFMDYTDGKYHSDYMMHLRQYGLDIAKKRISVVTYEDIEELK